MAFAAIGAVAASTVIGGTMQASAAKDAARQQSDGAREAANVARENNSIVREDLLPYSASGLSAVDMLADAMGMKEGMNPATSVLLSPFRPTMEQLEATPGYQFAKTQGLKAVNNSASARGLGISGAALKGAASYATGLADQTFQNQFSNDQAQKTNAFNKLMSMATLGESAAAQTGALGTQNAAYLGNAMMSAGNAGAQGTLGAGAAYGNMFGRLGSIGMML
jgi:hypothetical protein